MGTATAGWLAGTLLGAAPGGAGGEAIDLVRAAECFAAAEARSRADGGRLWGVPLYGPMLFVDRISREVVANRADAEGRLQPRGGVWVGVLPDDQGAANTAVEWAGVEWTMLLWPLPENRYRRDRLLTHEMFHRIQDDLGLPMSNSDCAHLDTREGRTWMRVEWRALSEALIRRGDARRAALEDALIFRARRRSIFPGGVADERALELNEGLAEYTGFAACGLPAHVLADRAAIQLDDCEDRPTFVRNFAYASGPAWGILLDEAGVDWRAGLTVASDLGELAAASAGVRVPDDPALETLALARLEPYEGHRVLEEEAGRERRREAKLAAMRRRFVEGPILVLPATGEIGYTYDPNGVEAFEGVGTVYRSVRVTDDWGILEVSAGGALMAREGAMVARFLVPAPGDPDARPLAGEGWTLELAEGWTLEPSERDGDFVVVPER